MGEEELRDVVEVFELVVEAVGALIIFVGAIVAFGRFLLLAATTRSMARFTSVRLSLGRFLALGLEFQLAADVLRTAISPSFEEIGELAAIAAIRTALNFFLALEIREERAELERDEAP